MLRGLKGVVREGTADRVVFLYPGEEGTYIENCHVRVYSSGIVHVNNRYEDTMCHISNCEILWSFTKDGDDRPPAVRLLRAKSDTQPSPP